MEVYTKASWTKFMTLIPSIRKNPDAWRVIEVILEDKSDRQVNKDVTQKIQQYFDKKEGAIFSCGEDGIMVMANLGVDPELDKIQSGLGAALENYSFQMKTYPANVEGMRRIEIVISNPDRPESEMTINQRRNRRKDRRIFVVDDDMFMRSLIVTSLKDVGTIFQYDDGQDLQEEYLKHAPDAVFLDIHMPGKDGRTILKEIMEWDPDAYVIMVSADSVPVNVLDTKEKGAKWFLSKPVSKDKVLAALKLNPDFAKNIKQA